MKTKVIKRRERVSGALVSRLHRKQTAKQGREQQFRPFSKGLPSWASHDSTFPCPSFCLSLSFTTQSRVLERYL